MLKPYRGETEIDRNINYVHTVSVSHVKWDGVPITRVTLRRYIRKTGRLVDEMNVPTEALEVVREAIHA